MKKHFIIFAIFFTLLMNGATFSDKSNIESAKVIKIASDFSKQNCIDFALVPGQSYIEVAKFESYEIFKNHYLFGMKDRNKLTEFDKNWLSYLNDKTFFENQFGWLKKNYSEKSFWGVRNLLQRKNPGTSYIGFNSWGWIFIDAEKMEGIPDPRIKNSIECERKKSRTDARSETYNKLNRKEKLFASLYENRVLEVSNLLKKEVPLNKTENAQAFEYGIAHCNVEVISLLLKSYKIHPQQINSAISCGNSSLIEKMLEKQKGIKEKTYFDYINTSLLFQEENILDVFIKYWKSNKFGSDTLRFYLSIVSSDNKNVRKYINNPKFGVNYSFKLKGWSNVVETPFWLAIKSKNLKTAELLIENGAKADFSNSEKVKTLLSFLFYYKLFGEKDIKSFFKLLQKKGVDTSSWNLDYMWDFYKRHQ